MRAYTGRGDRGKTGLLFGKKVMKDNSRIECLGDLDELNSFLGLAKAVIKSPAFRRLINCLQYDIYIISSEVATETKNLNRLRLRFSKRRLSWLEGQIDKLSAGLKLKNSGFFVSGENFTSALLDVCRTVCRRAERSTLSFTRRTKIQNAAIIPYLNRLSSLLFVLARQASEDARDFLNL